MCLPLSLSIRSPCLLAHFLSNKSTLKVTFRHKKQISFLKLECIVPDTNIHFNFYSKSNLSPPAWYRTGRLYWDNNRPRPAPGGWGKDGGGEGGAVRCLSFPGLNKTSLCGRLAGSVSSASSQLLGLYGSLPLSPCSTGRCECSPGSFPSLGLLWM